MNNRIYKGEEIKVTGYRGTWKDVRGNSNFSQIQYTWNNTPYDKLKDAKPAIDKVTPSMAVKSKVRAY